MPLEFNEAVQTGERLTDPIQIGSHEQVTSEVDLEARTEEARLCEELDAYMSRRNKTVARGLSGILACIVTMVILGLPILTLPHNPSREMMLQYRPLIHALLWPILAAGAGFILFGGWLLATSWNRGVRHKAERLRECATLCASSTLMRLLGMDDGKVRHSAEQALLQIAPFWGEAEFAVFGAKERLRIRVAILSLGLKPWRKPDVERYYPVSPELRTLFCRRVAWFGNREDLTYLRLAQRMPAVTSGQRRVRQAAKEAIPILEARLTEQNRPHTLLRASATPQAQPDELLRGAGNSLTTPAEELLRPEG